MDHAKLLPITIGCEGGTGLPLFLTDPGLMKGEKDLRIVPLNLTTAMLNFHWVLEATSEVN